MPGASVGYLRPARVALPDAGVEPCPACGADEVRVYLDGCGDRLHEHPGTWRLMECRRCRLVYTVPFTPAADLAEYYPVDYGPHAVARELRATRPGRALRSVLTLPYRVRFGAPDWAPTPFGEGRLLDVGCGSGALLARMTGLGWRCSGIDPNPAAVQRARERVPVARVTVGGLDAVEVGAVFDLITVSHVLEHLPDPVAALRRLAALLSPRGQLFISLPNLDSLEARVFGKRWVGLDVPRHCLHFRRGVLEALLERHGFEVCSVRPALFASSVSESMILALPRWLRRRLIGSRAARDLYLLVIPLAVLSYVLGNAGVIEVVARKRARESSRGAGRSGARR